jgi:hypothetical protein
VASAVQVGLDRVGPVSEPPGRGADATGGARFDWVMAGLGSWLLGGLYLDGWAHIHVPALETFFTPWHAVLYSGYLASVAALVLTFFRHRRRGAARSRALPPGYRLSLAGAFIFFVAGVADMLWHVVFGIEDGVEGLISPSHLALAYGGGLMVTGPLRAGLDRDAAPSERWLRQMPMALSLTLFVSLLSFFTEYASPYGTTWVTYPAASGPMETAFVYQSVGLAGFLVQPVVLMGPVLYVLRRRSLPVGSFTLLLSVSVALMAIIHDTYLDTGPGPLIGAAVLAGVAGDMLLARLRPSPARPAAFRVVAFAVPAVQYLLYFLAVLWWATLTWSVHLSVGAIAAAGGVGWLVSYLVLPPGRHPAPPVGGPAAAP